MAIASCRRCAQLGKLAKPESVGHDTWVGVIDRESRGYKNGVIDILYKLTGIRYEPEGRWYAVYSSF